MAAETHCFALQATIHTLGLSWSESLVPALPMSYPSHRQCLDMSKAFKYCLEQQPVCCHRMPQHAFLKQHQVLQVCLLSWAYHHLAGQKQTLRPSRIQ